LIGETACGSRYVAFDKETAGFDLSSEEKRRKGRLLTNVVALDFGASGTKVVRMRRAKDGPVILGADVLDPFVFSSGESADSGRTKFSLPKKLRANYAAVSVSGERSAVSLISVPASHASGNLPAIIRKQMALEGEHRISFIRTGAARSKGEASFLAVAMPEEDAQAVLAPMASGIPAPVSLEVSGLSALAAFLHGPGRNHSSDCVALVEAGKKSICLAIIDAGTVVLARMLDFGADRLERAVAKKMGLNEDVTMEIIADGAFDTSDILQEVMGAFYQQLIRANDYVERRGDTRISRIYLSGGLCHLDSWGEGIRGVTGREVTVLNPLDGIRMAPDAYPEKLVGQEGRFTAAVGAALNVLESTQ